MAETLVIHGGKKLSGEVTVSSAKNSAVALLPAVVLAQKPVKIFDVPRISDVSELVYLLSLLNIYVEVDGSTLTIDPTGIDNIVLDDEACTRLRASYYFMGALLGRFRYCKMLSPGGCYLGPRPYDLHLKGFEALGAHIVQGDGFIELFAEELKGTDIFLDISSVGATINIIMAAVYATGKTVIHNAAKEPEIIDLTTMLNKMGAKIRGAGTSDITIEGVKELGGCMHEIIPDRIEAGTYIVMAAAAGENVTVRNVIPQHIDALLSKLEEMGVVMDIGRDYVKVIGTKNLHNCEVKTLPYPGFATDLQQPLTVLMTKALGTSKVTETIYVERFKHCRELNKMGADIEVKEGESVIHGGTLLKGCDVTATDLRAGAAMIIAGLIAEGTTTIHDAYHIFRGYADVVNKLKGLGADVEAI